LRRNDMPTATNKGSKKDFVPSVDVRWCPGCGDYAILNTLQNTFASMGIPREKFVIVSGIGCSSRFPYYMNTYGFHTVHGRAPSVATGIKVANPDLSVWIITGDGDGLSIGGNHLLHILRRNIDVNVLLFNNEVYGLTKGQYSPTSKQGTVSKTSPMGSLESPINPLRFALSAEASFVARTMDKNPKHMAEVFKAAANHKGTSFIEILQNCVIFNNNVHDPVYGRNVRDETLLILNEGKPLIFGSKGKKGVSITGFRPSIVTVGEQGITEKDIHVHNSQEPSSTYAYMLSEMRHPGNPVPMGVLRAIERPMTFENSIEEQVKDATLSYGRGNLQELLKGNEYWEVTEDDAIKLKGSGPGRLRTEEMTIMMEQIKDVESLSSNRLIAIMRSRVINAVEKYGTFDAEALSPWDSVSSAIELLKKREISSAPVVEKGRLVGIVTEKDILLKVVEESIDRDEVWVEMVMSARPQTLKYWNTIGDAINKLATGNFRHLPVLHEGGKIGLISVKGIMSYITESLQMDTFPPENHKY